MARLGGVPLYNYPRWPSAASEGSKASYCHHSLGMDVKQKNNPRKETQFHETINAVSFCTAVICSLDLCDGTYIDCRTINGLILDKGSLTTPNHAKWMQLAQFKG